MYTYMKHIGHIVFQLWTVNNNQFLRLHQIQDKVDEYVSKLREMYPGDQNTIQVYYYKPRLSDSLVSKLKSYMELFYNAKSLHDTVLLMQLERHCINPNDLMHVITKLYESEEFIDINAYLSYEVKHVSRDNKNDVCLTDYTEIYNMFTNRKFVNETVNITVKTFQYDSSDPNFKFNISIYTLLDIAKCVIRSCNVSSTLSDTFIQPIYIYVAQDGGFKISDTFLNVTKNDALWILDKVASSQETIQFYVDIIYNIKKSPYEEKESDSSYCTVVKTDDGIDFDPRCKIGTSYDPDKTDNVIKPRDIAIDDIIKDENNNIEYVCRIDDIRNTNITKLPKFEQDTNINLLKVEKTVVKDSNIDDIIKDDKNNIDHVCKIYQVDIPKPFVVDTYKLISYENLCTRERVLAKFASEDFIYPEFNVLETILDCSSEKDADASIHMIQQIQRIASTFDVIPRSKLWSLLTSLENKDDVDIKNCNCKLCTNDVLFDIDQKTMISHMVNVLKLDKDKGFFCMSSDLSSYAEDFINKTNAKLVNVSICLNKNNTSTYLSNLLQKKRRFNGMTFMSRVPSTKEIDDLATNTATIIMRKFKKK